MQYYALAAADLFGTLSAAQTVASKPFNLLVTSADGKYKNAPLAACHIGAGIEALCLGYGTAEFGFNSTVQGENLPNGDVTGLVTYTLNSSPPWSQALGFYLPFSTNVAQAIFGEQSTQFAFDSQNILNIPTNYNDLVNPPTDGATETAYYRFYACKTNFEGYQYETLNWVYGEAKPQNPSCTYATVKRAFL